MVEFIGERVISKAGELCAGVLRDYQKEINEAYISVDDALTVRIPVKFKPESGGTAIEVGIAFYTGQVKDRAEAIVDENQGDLFDHADEERRRLREILWRSFEDIRRRLFLLEMRMKRQGANNVVFRDFRIAA